MQVNIAFGKDICFALWEEDFAQMIRLVNDCNGDIMNIDLAKINSDTIANLLNSCTEAGAWAFISDEQMKIINKLEKHYID